MDRVWISLFSDTAPACCSVNFVPVIITGDLAVAKVISETQLCFWGRTAVRVMAE